MVRDDLLDRLLRALLSEGWTDSPIAIPEDAASKRHLLRMLMNMEREPAYSEFVNRSFSGRLLLLELGVGFNTPSIIRWPFERIALKHPCATLVRVNLDNAAVPDGIGERGIAFQEDIARVLKDTLGLTR